MFEKIMGFIGYVPVSRLRVTESEAKRLRIMLSEYSEAQKRAARLPECAGIYCFRCEYAVIQYVPVIHDPDSGAILSGTSFPQNKVVAACKKCISCPDFCERREREC
ncbi:MAG: hypothetical protein MR419_06815 [Clostridiales bacterium]|nr:hypothetical protein [Clostridiales bacterium]MDY4171910.1 hypothetical protein [Evtepia sp.]